MRNPKSFYVYMMANVRRGVLYIGVTSDLPNRGYQHRTGLIEGFTRRYGLKTLVWYEWHADAREAIAREKRLKRRRRAWKFELIEAVNPEWLDLWPDLVSGKEYIPEPGDFDIPTE
jgi:putative endonuclease